MRRSAIEQLHKKAQSDHFKTEMLIALLKPVMDRLEEIFNEQKDKS